MYCFIQKRFGYYDMNTEKHTHKQTIDNRLKQADWNVTDHNEVVGEFDIVLDANLATRAAHTLR